jgi:MoaA/NifB/PqqE/SkfB family radical SAM enzyme
MKELKFLINKLPSQLILYPTSRCNASCQHCYNFNREDGTTKENELTLEEINKISLGFGHMKALTISGGEPFLRDDIKEMVDVFYKNNSLQYVSFHTNAFLTRRVVDPILDVLKSCKDLKVIVCVSIDGVGEIHDNIRGVPKGFEKMCQTVKELERIKEEYPNLFLISSTIFSQSTRESFPQTIEYIRKSFKTVHPALCFIRGEVRKSSEKEIEAQLYKEFYEKSYKDIDPSIKPFSFMALKATLDWMTHDIVYKNHVNQTQTVPCQAGRKLVVIYENGDVYPCEQLSEKFGNIRDAEYDVKKLLFNKEGELIKKNIFCEKFCHCTWENIINANLVFDLKSYPKIFYNWFRLFISN